MLDVNTESLKQMVSITASANTEIEQAVELLNRISSHNDWCCPERYQINDGIQRCRRTASIIMESSERFLRTISVVLDEFLEKEATIWRLFENVEIEIKKALEITATGVNVSSGLLPPKDTIPMGEMLTKSGVLDPGWRERLKDFANVATLVKNLKPAVLYASNVSDTISETISVVNFKDLNL